MSLQLRIVKEVDTPANQKKVARLVKPFVPEPGQTEQGIAVDQTPHAEQVSTVGAGRRILVVDDDQFVLKAFEMKLKADGFTVSTTPNANAVASTAAESKAQLIILDVNFRSAGVMDWNGFTVMKWLQRFAELDDVPVILISSSELPHYREQAMAAGAVAFFQKPIQYKDLLDVMLSALEGSVSAQSGA